MKMNGRWAAPAQWTDRKVETMAKKKAKAGDVIFVDRGLFRHFGVYVGHDRVIHYAPPKGEFKFDADEACIHEASMEEFLDGDETYYVCDFSEDDHRDDDDDSWWDMAKKSLRSSFICIRLSLP